MKRSALVTATIIVLVALAATGFTYYERRFGVPDEFYWIQRAFDLLQFPAFVLSAFVGRNFHNPPFLLHYGLVFLTYAMLAYLAFAVWRRMWSWFQLTSAHETRSR
jgi:hypothetical protein